ncbi:hypothetical protein NIES2104_34770 [Leptolyngbya sp. NIES-2104]|nr:hypothetical protein NIES2104_34770 [Leptolyngbya sp. NIES-2104]
MMVSTCDQTLARLNRRMKVHKIDKLSRLFLSMKDYPS